MKLHENADFDHRAAKLHPLDGRGPSATPAEEFSDRGRGDIKSRPNNPRFADNSMSVQDELDEQGADGAVIAPNPTQIERLHDMLSKAQISDQEIKHGVKLTARGNNIAAARLGISPDDVQLMINSLTQQLRDVDSDKMALAEEYHRMMNEVEVKPSEEAESHELNQLVSTFDVVQNTKPETDWSHDVIKRFTKKKEAGYANRPFPKPSDRHEP